MNTIEQKEKENLENYQHSPFNWCPSNVKTFQNSLLWKIELPQKLQRCQGGVNKEIGEGVIPDVGGEHLSVIKKIKQPKVKL